MGSAGPCQGNGTRRRFPSNPLDGGAIEQSRKARAEPPHLHARFRLPSGF
jgi:hypothetical protein